MQQENDPTVTRAMALALMRQALELLDAVNEHAAAAHLQLAVDTLLRRPRPVCFGLEN